MSSATLYRQVAVLSEAGILRVVEERRVRGAVERTYELHVEASRVSPEELAEMSKDDHRHAFAAFVSGLLASFDDYLASSDEPDFVEDAVGYRQNAMWLTDDEVAELIADLRGVLLSRIEHGPAAGRRRRLFTTVLMPAEGPQNQY